MLYLNKVIIVIRNNKKGKDYYIKKSIKTILPVICLLSLTSCGGETYTQVTDDTTKASTLKAAQTANAAETSYTSILGKGSGAFSMANDEEYSEGTKNSVSAVSYKISSTTGVEYIASSKDIHFYVTNKKDAENYYTIDVTENIETKAITSYFDGKAKIETNSASTSISVQKKLSTNISNTTIKIPDSTSSADISASLTYTLSVPDISDITISSDVNIYTGSKGSTKIESSYGGVHIIFVVDKNGDITLANIGFSYSSSGISTVFSEDIDFTYNTAIPSLNGADYETASAADLIYISSIMAALSLGMN